MFLSEKKLLIKFEIPRIREEYSIAKKTNKSLKLYQSNSHYKIFMFLGTEMIHQEHFQKGAIRKRLDELHRYLLYPLLLNIEQQLFFSIPHEYHVFFKEM